MYQFATILLLLVTAACGKSNGKKDLANALNNELSDSQLSIKTDLPIIANQDKLITLDVQQELPNPLSSAYYQVNIIYQKNKSLNYQNFPKGTREIHIKGKTIKLQNMQDGPQSELYQLLKDTYDVASLVIEAEEVYIYDPLRLRHANVKISAKRLVFARKGLIDITPHSLKNRAHAFQDGVDGLSAGKIILAIKEFQVGREDYPVLIANGGNGQAAGPGQNGARGANAKIVHGSNHYQYRREYCDFVGREPRTKSNKATNAFNCHWSRKKKGRPAKNGKNAKVGGMPGAAGNGGTIYSTTEAPFQVVGGIAGSQEVVRFGGEAGQPAKSCKYDDGSRSRSREYDCVIAKNGKNAFPKTQRFSKGKNGRMWQFYSDWVNDGYIINHLEYAKDLYIANNPKLAYQEFSILEQRVEQKIFKSLTSMKALSEINSLKAQINMHLDYFGNPMGWVPNFNLGLTYSLYKEEVRKNIDLILKTKSLLKKIQTQKDSKLVLEALRKDTQAVIKEKTDQVNTIISEQVDLKEDLASLEVSQDEFEYELTILEEEIKKMAKRNLRVPFMQKAVRFFAAASKAIPVGQPTFAAVGLGLDFINNTMEGDNSAFELMSQVPSVASKFKDFDWNKATNELSNSIKSMGIESLKESLAQARTAKEKQRIQIEHFEKIQKFTSKIYGEVSQEMARWKQRETDQTALNTEIAKIKKSHPVYLKIVNKLEKLLYEKQNFMVRINTFQNQLINLTRGIEDDTIVMLNISDSYHKIMRSSLFEFENHLRFSYRRAYDRIRYYRYLLAKSYSYRVMKQYPINYSATAFIKRFDRILAENSDYSESKVEEVFTLFENELLEIVAQMVEEIEDRGTGRILSKEYLLTDEEVTKLNSGEEVYLNFTKENFYGEGKEDLRLLSIELIDGFDTEGEQSGDFEISFSHIGKSLLRKDGHDYLFLHDKGEKNGQFRWLSYYSLYSNTMHTSQVDLSNDSLLFVLIVQNYDRNVSSHIRPGARTFIRAKLETLKNIKINKAVIKIRYSYRD